MAAFESCPKHNMVVYLEKTKGNAQFHEIVDFLSRSSIFYALTVSPNVSTSLIEQFWNSAVSQTVNNVSQIKATVSGQTVLISESSIRRDLLFNDDNGIDCLTVADIYENLPLMGYEGDLTTLTFQKALFSPQWKYLIHTIIHCLSSKSTSWDQFPTNVASAVICLATDRTFNFSKMIFDGMNRNLEAKKKFLMYPRFFIICQEEDSTFQGTCDTYISYMVVPYKQLEVVAAEILKLKTSIKKLEKKWSEKYQPRPYWITVPLISDVDLAHEVLEKGGSNEEPVNAAGNIRVSTVVPKVSTVNISTISRLEDSTATPMTPPTTTSVFDNKDITLAETLVKMKDDKAKLKGVAIKEVEESDRPARSVLTLKPLLKINPKDKGKGVLEEEPELAKKLKKSDLDAAQLAMDEEKEKVLEEPDSTKMEVKQEEVEENTRKRPDMEQRASKIQVLDLMGRSRMGIKTFSEMVTRFDRLDLVELYNLKMKSSIIKKDGILRAGISMRIIGSILILEDGSDDENPPPPPPQTPTQQAPHTLSTIKLLILKKGEYDIWAMKMEHSLSHTDYPIWEVIQKGKGSVSVSTDTNGVINVLPLKTAKEILARERERKARTTLLMALPEDHLAKFHKMTDAKEMWEAIKSRFSGNDESKKMQKYILKQQFESFSVSNSEGLHKGYDRFQSLLSQLKIHGAGVSTKDANQKFLRSLPSSWSQVSLVMRTKPRVDSLSFDDLYNNLRVFESDVKGSIGSSSSTQNVAFVSSESTTREEEASKAAIAEMYDEVQVGIATDALFAAKLQQEERDEFTIEERAKFLAETIAAQRKFRAAQRPAEIRKIQGLYERQKRVIDDFKPMDSNDVVKDTKEAAGVHKEKVIKEPDSTKAKVKQEGHKESIRKRPGRRLKMKATKKSKMQKTDSNLEKEKQLKAFLNIVPDEEGEVNYEVLDTRYPIVNWESKFYHLDRHGAECIYYRIFRSDGSSRWIKTFSEMVARTMFKANADDDLWKNQEEWILKSWNFYENCGVHTLILEDGTEIHILAKRKYPLTIETLERMMALKLIAESASDSAYNLLRFIQKHIDEARSHDRSEKEP
ncbi:hypothetical protein Tco_1402115 [Tanacetum coccineum]